MKVQASYGEYSVDGISKAAQRAEEQGYEIFSASETAVSYTHLTLPTNREV